MSQYWSNSWTNVSKKPKGFKFIDRNIYEYEVLIIIDAIHKDREKKTFKENIPIIYRIDKETNMKEIDLKETSILLKDKLGIDFEIHEAYTGLAMFKRDGAMFPFLEYLNLGNRQTSEYMQFKVVRDRVQKINNIRKKI